MTYVYGALALIGIGGLVYAATWFFGRGRDKAEGVQAKEGLKVSKRIQDVPQPLPGETDKALRDGEF